MNEQDYITIYWEAQSMGVSAIALYLTIISGYLVASFVSASRLTKAQFIFVSTLFVAFSGFTCWGVFEYWSSAFQAAQTVEEKFVFNRLGVNPAYIALPTMILTILGCLKFSTDIRNSKENTEG